MIQTPSDQKTARPGLQRPGLTLIELIVVLMILIALAGLLIPMLPSMLTRSHTATCATNMGATSQAIAQYQALYSGYPAVWDQLTDGTTLINYFAGSGGPGGANPTWPAGQGNGMANGEITQGTLQTNALGENEAANLTGVGIQYLQPMVATAGTAPGGPLTNQPFDPTFNYYKNTTNISAGVSTGNPVTAGMVVALLDPANNPAAAARCSALNLSPTGRYVLLGIGQWCSMVGKTIQTAPIHFGDQPALNPEYGYQHLVAIFYVSDTNSAYTITQARLVGTAPVHDTGLGNIQDETQNWYQLTTGGS